MLIFQVRTAPAQNAAEQNAAVRELRDFLGSSRKPVFVPEYEYKTFFFVYDPLVNDEQLGIANKILAASPETKVVFYFPSKEQAKKYADGIASVHGMAAKDYLEFEAKGHGAKSIEAYMRKYGEKKGIIYTGYEKPADYYRRNIAGIQNPSLFWETPRNQYLMELVENGRLEIKSGEPAAHEHMMLQLRSESKITASDFMAKGRILFKAGGYTKERWAQDLGEPVGGFIDKEKKVSEYIVGWMPSDYKDMARGSPAREDDPGVKTTMIPAELEGGNFTKARSSDGTRWIVIGAGSIIGTYNTYRENGYGISLDEIKAVYLKAFGGDKVLILGADEKKPIGEWDYQPDAIFHIDQCVLFPKDGTAVLLSPPQEMEDEGIMRDIAGYKKQLLANGFEVVEIPTTEDRIKEYQSYANGNAINSRNRTTVILPSFGMDDGVEEEAVRILKMHGMDVLLNPNETYRRMGNTHCMTGALSYNDLAPAPKKSKSSGLDGPRA
ncbi:MAG: hypothetical protein WC717_06070 [Candidatus Micrarchaeia archaeon]|jgi:hypothetical protein